MDRSVLNVLSIGIIMLDENSCVVLANDWLQQRIGIPREQLIDKNLAELFPELEQTRLLRACEHALQMNLSSLLSSTLHRAPLPLFSDDKRSRRIDQAITVKPVKHEGKKYCLIEIHDVTAINQKEQVLRQQAMTLSWQATHDALTGLANRNLLTQSLEEHVMQARNSQFRHCLILLNLDQFKRVNDGGNHNAGDEGLKQVAEVLRTTVRGGDLAARLGADEFALLLPYCDSDNARKLGLEICAGVAALIIRHEHNEWRLSISGGLSVIDSHIATTSEVWANADNALRQAKKIGGNQIVCFQTP